MQNYRQKETHMCWNSRDVWNLLRICLFLGCLFVPVRYLLNGCKCDFGSFELSQQNA